MKTRFIVIGIGLIGFIGGMISLSASQSVGNVPQAAPTPGIYVTNPYINTVTVYPIDAAGDATPIQTITGPDTGLDYPFGIALDSTGNIFVVNYEAETLGVYAPGSDGDAIPIYSLLESTSGITLPSGVAVDSSGFVYVANIDGGDPYFGSITTYPPLPFPPDQPPIGTIVGADTGLIDPSGIAADSAGNIYVANLEGAIDGNGSITVYSHTDAITGGDVVPMVTIAGNLTGLSQPSGVAIGTYGTPPALPASPNEYLYVANNNCGPVVTGCVTVYQLPLAGGSHNPLNLAPIATIVGPDTGLNNINGLSVDSGGTLYVTEFTTPGSITVYPPASNGDQPPIATIAGVDTGLGSPRGIVAAGTRITPTGTSTRTTTSTPTASATVTATSSPTDTASPSPTDSATTTVSPTATTTLTSSPTATTSTTQSPTSTATATLSPTSTTTATASSTRTTTATSSPTTTSTSTLSLTVTITPTVSKTATPSPTATKTVTATTTATTTATPSRTATITNTPSPTISTTATVSPTATRTSTATTTLSVTATPSSTATLTISATATRTATSSPTPTLTATRTATLTATPMPTATATATSTAAAAIFVANTSANSINGYSAGSDGNAPPVVTISGSATSLSSLMGLALDAGKNLYVTGNTPVSGKPSVTIFPAGSSGNVAPSAIIVGTATGLASPDGIVLDTTGKIYVCNSTGGKSSHGSVTIYPSGSSGNAAPTATITGTNTGLKTPQGIALGATGNIFVANQVGGPSGAGSVTVYAPSSSGNAAPIATIAGSNTGLNTPDGVGLDSAGNIYVANSEGGTPNNGSITIYAAGSNGNVAPMATIGGTHTQLNNPREIALDGVNIYVANNASHGGGAGEDSVTTYPIGSSGNVTPSAEIVGGQTGLLGPEGIAVAPVHITPAQAIFVTNSGNDSITAYPFGSTGNIAPSVVITGSNTQLNSPFGISMDSGANLHVVNRKGGFKSRGLLAIFPFGTRGNPQPGITIAGPDTQMNAALDIHVDPVGNDYVSNRHGGSLGLGSITVFAAGSSGDAIPTNTIAGGATGLNNLQGITLDSASNIYVSNAPASPSIRASAMKFSAGSSGNIPPSATIRGTLTGIVAPHGAAVDASGKIYIANKLGGPSQKGSVTIFAPGSSGNTAPIATITGPDTGLNHPLGITLDSTGNLYVANPANNSVTVYSPGSTGDAIPIAVIKGASTQLSKPQDIVVGPISP
ncbi:MAG TPA: hypothetical protein VMU16_08310 [Candidatus Binataceae bacterium]|nr:hypothetical protein [Candidatus Binataceae bacterium]